MGKLRRPLQRSTDTMSSLNNTPSTTNGACLCGKVTLVATLDRDVVACHCQQCRKQTGHFVAATRAPDSALQIRAAEHLIWFAASDTAKRGFCKHCGSVMLWKANGSEHTSIMAGCLESPTGLTLASHIYVDDKGDYYSIEDGLPQFAKSD